jgi:hypothetical protein
MKDKTGDRKKNQQMTGEHADLDGLCVTELGRGEIAKDFTFRFEDQALVGHALGVAAV